jgi:hypothetical protein
MELFKPLWKSISGYKREKWINEKSDLQNRKHLKILEEIAENDKEFSVRQTAYEKLGKKECQESLADIALNAYNLETRFDATIKLQDDTLKTNSLVALFEKTEKYEREKIAKLLKKLYKTDRLSPENKAKILALKGKTIFYHDDFQGNSCYPGHGDSPGVYFEF